MLFRSYASEETRGVGEALIRQELESIPKAAVKEIAVRNLEAIATGRRDFRF